MNVGELILILRTMPKSAPVMHLWDGEARTEIEHVWVARNGEVITADNKQPCYSIDTMPHGSPLDSKNWTTGVRDSRKPDRKTFLSLVKSLFHK